MSPVLLVVIAILVVFFFVVVGTYNRLVKLRNRSQNAFSQIDVQLNRRYDLIPNLVETAKAYMKHESETLEKVIKARNQAYEAKGRAQSGEGIAVAQLANAEAGLARSLGSFMALAENYPDLKANETMQNLMEELTSTENKVAYSRQGYNDAVLAYNTGRETFPSHLIAGLFNFKAAVAFTVEEPEAKKAVKVAF